MNINYLFLPSGVTKYHTDRSTASYRSFRNWGNSLLYKHLFPKSGEELTADLNLNKSNNQNNNK